MKFDNKKYYIIYKRSTNKSSGTVIEKKSFENIDNFRIVLSGYKRSPYINVIEHYKK